MDRLLADTLTHTIIIWSHIHYIPSYTSLPHQTVMSVRQIRIYSLENVRCDAGRQWSDVCQQDRSTPALVLAVEKVENMTGCLIAGPRPGQACVPPGQARPPLWQPGYISLALYMTHGDWKEGTALQLTQTQNTKWESSVSTFVCP